MVAPTVETIAEAYKGRLKVCKLNVDEAGKTASGYGIMSMSTPAIFKNGEVVNKVIGVVTKSELEAEIKAHI